MRYAEQLKYSWNYSWGIFREIWDIFTLKNYHLLIIGLMVVLCVLPTIVCIITPTVHYYVTTPEPPFDPTLSQDIITDYYFIIKEKPSVAVVVCWHWIGGRGHEPLTDVLCLVATGLLVVAYLRQRSPVRGREE